MTSWVKLPDRVRQHGSCRDSGTRVTGLCLLVICLSIWQGRVAGEGGILRPSPASPPLGIDFRRFEAAQHRFKAERLRCSDDVSAAPVWKLSLPPPPPFYQRRQITLVVECQCFDRFDWWNIVVKLVSNWVNGKLERFRKQGHGLGACWCVLIRYGLVMESARQINEMAAAVRASNEPEVWVQKNGFHGQDKSVLLEKGIKVQMQSDKRCLSLRGVSSNELIMFSYKLSWLMLSVSG